MELHPFKSLTTSTALHPVASPVRLDIRAGADVVLRGQDKLIVQNPLGLVVQTGGGVQLNHLCVFECKFESTQNRACWYSVYRVYDLSKPVSRASHAIPRHSTQPSLQNGVLQLALDHFQEFISRYYCLLWSLAH